MKSKISSENPTAIFIVLYCVITVLSLWIGVASELYILAAIPLALLLVFVTVVDFKIIFFLLLTCIALSTEVRLPGGVGMDLPIEPLTVGLMLVYGLFLLKNPKSLKASFVTHPITLLLLLHWGWIFFTTVTSQNLIVSIKFFLAKTWYIAVYYFLAGYLLQKNKDLRKAIWVVAIPMIFTMVIVLLRHAQYGFSFEKVNKVLSPFYRNHVNYAALLALFFPFVYLAKNWYKTSFFYRSIWGATVVFFLVAIYLTYTRAAYVSIILAAGAYIVIHLRLVKWVLLGAIIGAVVGVGYMVDNNKYLDYAPNFEKTITHKDFSNLVGATYKMEDVSTMERVYRWVAGGHMIADRPVLGFGPGNFYNFYKPYTVSSFYTYVSDNPEKSGVHNYYMMIFIEQGILGVIIFLALTFFVLWRAEQMYHLTADKQLRNFIMMFILCIVIIDAFLLMNDMIETDKVGILYFLSMAMLVNLDNRIRNELKSKET